MAQWGWTEDRATAWRAVSSREYLPQLWWSIGGAVVVLTAFTSQGFWSEGPCSDPSFGCGPSPMFAFVVPLVIVAFAALIVLPWATVVLSAVGGIVALAHWGIAAPGFAVWPAYALALAVWLGGERVARRRRQRIAAAVLEPLPTAAVGALQGTDVRARGWDALDALAAIVVLVGATLGALAYLSYADATAADRASVARSVVLDGTVVATPEVDEETGDAWVIEVRLEERPEGVPQTLELAPIDTYAIGDVVEVRVDPQRPQWAHPLWEPPDRTLRLGLGHGLALLALLAAAFLANQRLTERGPQRITHGVRVGVDRGLSTLYLRPLGSTWAFASIDLGVGDRLRAALSSGSAPGATDAYVVGMDQGSVVRVVTPAGVGSEPYTLEAARRGWHERAKAVAALTVDRLPRPQPAVTPQPVDWRPHRQRTYAARTLAATSLLLPVLVIPFVAGGWVRAGVGVVALAAMAVALLLDAPRLRVDQRRIVIRRLLTQRRIPMWTVAGVRVHFDQRVVLLDNTHGNVELDLGDRGAEIAAVIAAYASVQPALAPDVSGSSFAEAATTWWREAPLALMAPLAAVGLGLLLGR